MFLNAEQLRELTGKQRPSAQMRELLRMEFRLGIDFRVRSDGTLCVMRSAVDANPQAEAAKARKKTTPNFDKVA